MLFVAQKKCPVVGRAGLFSVTFGYLTHVKEGVLTSKLDDTPIAYLGKNKPRISDVP